MMQTGNIVNYHSIIGGPVTSSGHEITFIDRAPNNFGCDVAWVTGISGCVAIAALSNDAHPMQPAEKPLSRSQKRYRTFIESEYPDSYAEYIGVTTRCESRHMITMEYRYVNVRRRIQGPWCKTMKQAKADYKLLLV